jgi:DNA ligase-associated metallophosphoesterase
MSAEATLVEVPSASTLPPAGDGGDHAEIALAGTTVDLRSSGALYWPDRSLLCIADLHLGRAERLARAAGDLLPHFDSLDTLDRLETEIMRLRPRLVVGLGDCFDDLAGVRDLRDTVILRIGRLAAGRRWIWVGGTHDPGPLEIPGTRLAELRLGLLNFRDVALPRLGAGGGEVSSHFHPLARLTRDGARLTRRCFLVDGRRAVLPAFGSYGGGIDARDPAFDPLLEADARAFVLGRRITAVPRNRLR